MYYACALSIFTVCSRSCPSLVYQCIFGSNYFYASLFSFMNYVKNEYGPIYAFPFLPLVDRFISWCFWWDKSEWVGSIHIICIGISEWLPSPCRHLRCMWNDLAVYLFDVDFMFLQLHMLSYYFFGCSYCLIKLCSLKSMFLDVVQSFLSAIVRHIKRGFFIAIIVFSSIFALASI